MNLCLNNCVGQAARGPRKTFHSKRGPHPKKFENCCSRAILRNGSNLNYICTAPTPTSIPSTPYLKMKTSSKQLFLQRKTILNISPDPQAYIGGIGLIITTEQLNSVKIAQDKQPRGKSPSKQPHKNSPIELAQHLKFTK